MKTCQDYKGYKISYSSTTRNTRVIMLGVTIKRFFKAGEAKGLELAKEYIDSIISEFGKFESNLAEQSQ